MYIPDSHPHLTIETLPYGLEDPEFTQVAEQISYFTKHTIQDHYSTDLGLDRIDQDPEPGTPEELPQRLALLRSADARRVEYIVARDADEPLRIDAIAGFLATQREAAASEDEPESLEIVELDVAKRDRSTGLGRELLRYAMQDVGNEVAITLDVAEANAFARALYMHYGFEQYGEPIEHGVFDVRHIPMCVSSEILKRKLGLIL